MKKGAINLLCNLIMAFYAMSLTITSPLLSEIAASFTLTLAQSGIIFSANFAGFVVFILIGGALADRFGKKAVINFSLAGISLSLLAMPLASTFYTVCLLLFLIGGFSGVLESMISALLSDLNPGNPAFHVNLSQVFFGLGALIGPIAAGFSISGGISWRQCYLALGAAFAVLTIIFLYLKAERAEKKDADVTKGLKVLLSDPRFLLICFCMFLYSGSEVGSWGWLSTFLKKEAGFSVQASSAAVGVFWAAIILGRLVCGPLTYRLDEKRIIIILSAFSAVMVLLSGFAPGAGMIWLVIAGIGLGLSSLWPLIVSYGGNMYRQYSGTAFAVLVGSCGLGMMVIPYLLGILAEIASLRIAMMCPSALLLVIGCIFIFESARRRETVKSEGNRHRM